MARNCLLVNQFATPGLGSLMGRRILAGILQLTLALIGFGGFVGWFIQRMIDLYRQTDEFPSPPAHHLPLLEPSLIIFAASWCLSWITSLQLLREAKRNEAGKPPPGLPPPRIS